MLRQWLVAKARCPGAILLFRMGDFYELFADDAVEAAPILELALTSREKDKGKDAIAMAGFPHHAAPGYIAKLIASGHKVAVCDQLEDPAQAKGIVKRGVTRVVTPGMVLEDESLGARKNNHLVAVVREVGTHGLAVLDLSTGLFRAGFEKTTGALQDEILRLAPAEILWAKGRQDDDGLQTFLENPPPGARAWRLEKRAAPKRRRPLLKKLGRHDPYFDDPRGRAALQAAELILAYVEETQGHLPAHLAPPTPHVTDTQLLLDATTIRHLDLVERSNQRQNETHLVGLMDKSRSAMGGRAVRAMLLSPSLNSAVIDERHDFIDALLQEPDIRSQIRAGFAHLHDLERLTARAASGRLSPRELGHLRDTLGILPDLHRLLSAGKGDALKAAAASVALHGDLFDELDRALVEEPPLNPKDGPCLRMGYDALLDETTALATGGRDRIAAMEAEEREATGIPNLKVKYTRVFGYYIEVTKTHLKKVPAHYKRKQTVAAAERYVTDALARLEEEVAGAEARMAARQSALLTALQTRVVNDARDLVATAGVLGRLDALAGFAEVAERRGYCRPRLLPAEERRFLVEGGRHALVEAMALLEGESFIPNDLFLDGKSKQVLLVTGPNMAGKSTVMRQAALIQILAQAGAFVPASRAELSLCDRIFTRVGASDDLALGRSTFMVEMQETAHILRHATPHSLVLLDEIGRGTSTFDGLSLAWAVAEHLHDHTGARTLFATHYHELTALAESLERLDNCHVEVKEWNGEVVFVRTLAPGPSERSYGIHVAQLASIPDGVLDRARLILGVLEGQVPWDEERHGPTPRPIAPQARSRSQMELFRSHAPQMPEATAPSPSETLEALAAVNTDRLTPLDAINALAALVDRARRELGRDES
jgi:DNA mismatch repair protein MutS